MELTVKYQEAIESMGGIGEQEAIWRQFIEAIERASAPRPFVIKNEPEKPLQ